MLAKSFIYPTNNFGHQHNVRYYFYNTYVLQGNNWAGFGLHNVQVRNQTDKVVEVVGWTMKDGRVEEDFRVREVKPALFYTARLVPTNTSTSNRRIRGAVTFRFKGGNQTYTLAFDEKLFDVTEETTNVKGHIEQGSDVQRAIANLKDNKPKSLAWGSYEFREDGGRGRSVITFGKPRFTLPK